MGTRHLIEVKKDKRIIISQYGQWDGYLEGQGVQILKFLKDKEKVERLKKALNKVRFLDKEGKDKKFVESYDKNAPKWSNEPDNRTKEQIRWCETYFSRDIGADILENVANSDDKEILLYKCEDSSPCEYKYLIDFDKDKLIIEGTPRVTILDLNKLPTEKNFLKYDDEDE